MPCFARACICVGLISICGNVWAQSDERGRAAEAFDAGVGHYARAEYADAARAFLLADKTLPSADALDNALKSAQKAGDWLLVAEAARRATKHDAESPPLAARGREALVLAASKLATLDLRCENADCAIRIDGTRVEEIPAYVLPGSRVLVAEAAEGARAEERMSLAAGVRYQITLHPVAPGDHARRADVVSGAGAGTEVAGVTPGDGASQRDATGKPLSPGVFYAGVGVSVVLAGATVWSGADTLGAKSDLSATSPRAQVDSVRNKALRTDLLLGGTLLVSAATAYAGFALVDWGASPTVSVAPGSLSLGVRGLF
jgi:hypothetical protein